jgi:hypothetical protein
VVIPPVRQGLRARLQTAPNMTGRASGNPRCAANWAQREPSHPADNAGAPTPLADPT